MRIRVLAPAACLALSCSSRARRRGRGHQEAAAILVHRRGDRPRRRRSRRTCMDRARPPTGCTRSSPRLQEAHDGALRRAHGSVQEHDAAFGPEPTGAGTEHVHELRQRLVEPVHRVLPVGEGVVEDAPAARRVAALALDEAVALDHVDQPLPGVASQARVGLDPPHEVPERPLPVQVAVALLLAVLRQEFVEGGVGFAHGGIGAGGAPESKRTAQALEGAREGGDDLVRIGAHARTLEPARAGACQRQDGTCLVG